MRKTLIKKQLAEVFSGLFYDAKRNRTRTKGQVIVQIFIFAVLVFGVIGGMVTVLSLKLCQPMYGVGMGWLYFVVLGLIGLLMGFACSIFTCFNSIYKAKDNNLLLSMPIPAKDILISRIVNVFLISLIYSIVVTAPAVAVYLVKAKFSLMTILGGLDFIIVIALLATVFSCVIGWIVAKISARIKNKKAVTLILSLLAFGVYFFFVRNMNEKIQYLVKNAVMLGGKVKGAAYFLYLFGRIGEGDIVAILIFTAVVLALAAIVVYVLSRSFIKLVTTPEAVQKTKYTEKKAKQNSAFKAALNKEFRRFTSNTNYMLNCGLGIIFMPILGVYLLIKGKGLIESVSVAMGKEAGIIIVIISLVICMVCSMNDMVAPSISLEGKNLWIYQSMPIEGKTVIFAKIWVQLILTLIPAAILCACVVAILPFGAVEKLLCVLLPIAFIFLCAYADMYFALKKPNFAWTNEIIPIKQSAAVMIALLGGWAYAIVLGVLFFFVGRKLGAVPYMGIACAITIVLALVFRIWLKKNGNKVFASLGN